MGTCLLAVAVAVAVAVVKMELNATQQRIAWVVALYWMVSISLVFVNKVVMTSDGVSIPAPLFVTWFQCVFTAALCYLMGHLSNGNILPKGQFPTQVLDPAVAAKVMPLFLIFVGMITFNNMCLMYVEVSFYNVARSLTICFNVVLTYMILGSKTSTKTMGALCVVILGFYIGTEGEVNFSLIGTIFGVISSVFVSLNSIFTKKVLPHVNDDKWVLAFYNNVNASLIFLPCMWLAGEFSSSRSTRTRSSRLSFGAECSSPAFSDSPSSSSCRSRPPPLSHTTFRVLQRPVPRPCLPFSS